MSRRVIHIACILGFLALNFAALAQPATFFRTIGSAAVDEGACSIVEDPNGGFIVGGYAGDSAMLMHIDTIGSVQWFRKYKFTSQLDRTFTLKVTSDSFLIGVGNGINSSNTIRQGYYFKCDLSGNLIWSHAENTAQQFYLQSINEISANEYVVSGQTFSPSDGLIIRLNAANGNILGMTGLHNRPFASSLDDFTYCNVYGNRIWVTGRTFIANGSLAMSRNFLSKFDISGNQIQTRQYLFNSGLSRRMYGQAFVPHNDTLAMLINGDYSGVTSNFRAGLMAVDTSGNVLYAREYDIQGYNGEASRWIERIPGGYLQMGYTYGNNADMYFIKSDLAGNVEWCRSIGGTGDENTLLHSKQLFVYEGKTVMFIGQSNSFGSGDFDILIGRMDTVGQINCSPLTTRNVTVNTISSPYNGVHNYTNATNPFAAAPSGVSTASGPSPFVDPCPTVFIGNDTTICLGTTYQLNATTAGGTYIWQDGSTNSTFDVTSAGTYHVRVQTSCCTVRDTITVQTVPGFSVSIGNDTAICSGAVKTLTSTSPGLAHLWSTGATTPVLQVSAPGPYSVEVTDLNGCIARDTMNLIVNPTPSFSLPNDTTLCEGDSIILSAIIPMAQSYVWSTGATTPWIMGGGSNTYIAWAFTAAGCFDTDTIVIQQPATPVPSLGPDAVYCADQAPVSLNANIGAAAYAWNTGATTQSISVGVGGMYHVTTYDAFGCTKADSITIFINAMPVVNLGSDTNMCGVTSWTLDAGNPADIYSWNTGDSTRFLPVTISGTYSVTVTNAFGCISSDTITIQLGAIPVVDLPDDTVLCEASWMTLDAGNVGSSYLWSGGQQVRSISINQPGTYWVEVTSPGGCSSSDTIDIVLFPALSFDLGPDTNICVGDSLVLDAYVLGASYLWSTGETSSSIIIDSTGTYDVQMVSGFGCDASDEIAVTVLYPFDFELGVDHVACIDDVVTLATGIGGKNHLWSTGATGDSVMISETGTYWVVVSDECMSVSDTVNLEFSGNSNRYFLPNAFSPNGDGLNDVLAPVFSYAPPENYMMQVFNRWGALIFETHDPSASWDGDMNGVAAPGGNYTVVISFTDCLGELRSIPSIIGIIR